MGVADLPRWAWVAAGLLVGLTHGWVREWASDVDPLDDYPVLLTDQRQFEHALVAESHGHRHFKDIVVYPHRPRGTSAGRRQVVHLVTGAYWDGRTEMKDGAVRARWDPACYVAPVPYVPVSNLAATGGASSQPARPAVEPTSVLDHLATLRSTSGVEYRYAWWWWMRRPLFTSTVVGVVLIGGVVPAVLCLVAYGTLLPPPREKRPSLRGVKRGPSPTPSFGTSAVVKASERDDGVSAAMAPAASTVTGAPAQPLALSVAEPGAETPGEEKHFGAGKEDFYPTELHDTSKTGG